MAKGTATFGCVVTSGATGGKTVQVSVTLTSIVDVIETRNSSNLSLLQPGDNTINVPAGATLAAIEIPATPATVTWKGNAADVGTQMVSNTNQNLFAVMLVSGLSSFILNASAAIAGVEVNFL